MAAAAGCYAHYASGRRQFCYHNLRNGNFTEGVPNFWPIAWEDKWWKPKNPRRDLVRAAALIIAEIERLDRKAEAEGEE